MLKHGIVKTYLIIIPILLTGHLISAQLKITSNNKLKQFFEPVNKAMVSTPFAPDSLCNEYESLILHVENYKMDDSVTYVRNGQYAKTVFPKLIGYYKKANWKKMIQGAGTDFYLIQPFLFRFDNPSTCADSISMSRAYELANIDAGSLPPGKQVYLLTILSLYKAKTVN
jgi:hypothetical protein